MLNRTLSITLLVVLACAPAAAASPRAHSAAEQRAEASLEQAEQVLNGRGVRTGREATEVLRQLSLSVRNLRGEDRAMAAQLLRRPEVEGPTACEGGFCVHGVASGTLTSALVLAEVQKVHNFETETLGWRPPPNDGDGRVDVYLDDVGADRLFGYAQTDDGQTQRRSSFLVIDNDFDPAQYSGVNALESLRVTLAHEYAHVLQYGYDVLADAWHFESSAVWMEQRMYPEIKDWLRFIDDRATGGGWRSLTELPLTYFEPNPDGPGALDPRTAKVYGDVVWNQFLSSKYGSAGDALQRATWERSNGLDYPSTDAFDQAIRAAGGPGIAEDFAEFSAAVAEWQVPASPFPAPADLPDVERRGDLVPGGRPVELAMDHLSFAFYDVPETGGPIRLAASFPDGTSAAIALVARSGPIDSGEVTTESLELPGGGPGAVTIREPARFYASGGRVTAALVNADASHGPFWDDELRDWQWSRDDQRATARISADTRAPRVSLRGLRLRSRDTDRLTFEASLLQDGHTVGRRSGSVRPGATRRLRIRGGHRGRARLVVRLADPSANTKRLVRTLRLAA